MSTLYPFRHHSAGASSLHYVQSCVRKLQCTDKNQLLQGASASGLPGRCVRLGHCTSCAVLRHAHHHLLQISISFATHLEQFPHPANWNLKQMLCMSSCLPTGCTTPAGMHLPSLTPPPSSSSPPCPLCATRSLRPITSAWPLLHPPASPALCSPKAVARTPRASMPATFRAWAATWVSAAMWVGLAVARRRARQ